MIPGTYFILVPSILPEPFIKEIVPLTVNAHTPQVQKCY
jgi:hypothetical protein